MESTAQKTRLAGDVPAGARSELHSVQGGESRARQQLSDQFSSAVEFADFCSFLTPSVSDHAEQLVRVAEALHHRTTVELQQGDGGATATEPEEIVRSRLVAATREQELLGQIETLTQAMSSARVIGAAVGMLMARHDLTYDAAFARLVKESSTSNVKLRVVAGAIVDEANEHADAKGS